MTNALRHRGPDGCDVRVFVPEGSSTAAALGHRRLAILDLSDAGLQPMSNEDESVWVVFNGEIYNYRQLRADLLRKGHQFRSGTDSEVLVHLYEDFGPDFITQLTGMFAFAIFDVKAQRIVLARDQLGIKPLYYSLLPDGLAFGSEIKALLAARSDTPCVNWQAIYDYFTYLYVPGPATAFEGIEQLPPAHTLVYDLRCNQHQLARYWQVRRLEEVERAPREQIEEALYSSLVTSVSQELVSDVPLGLFLSGGIDSSILAGVARQGGVTPRTFTVAFSNSESRYYSEADVAVETSRFLGTEHRQLDVDSVDPFEMLGLVDHFDEPFGNPTFYLQWLIAGRAREHITVALNGAGGDELFAGYPRYRAAQLSRLLHHVPESVLRVGRRALDLARDDHRTMRLRRVREFFDGLDADPVREFANWTYFMNGPEKAELLQESTSSLESSERYLRRYYDETPVAGDNRLLHIDVQSFLADNLLVYTDRMSMAVGMEVRVPLLEPAFVEYALNIPYRWKLSLGSSKWIFRHAFRQFLTPSVRKGAKRGFNAPLALWIRDELDEYFSASEQSNHPLMDVLGEDIGATWKNDAILNWNYIDQMRREHRDGRKDLSYELFSVIVFDVWWRKYITGSLPITRWTAVGAA